MDAGGVSVGGKVILGWFSFLRGFGVGEACARKQSQPLIAIELSKHPRNLLLCLNLKLK